MTIVYDLNAIMFSPLRHDAFPALCLPAHLGCHESAAAGKCFSTPNLVGKPHYHSPTGLAVAICLNRIAQETQRPQDASLRLLADSTPRAAGAGA